MASNLDPRVASVLDRTPGNVDTQDEDDLIEKLEEDDALDAFREQRLQQLHSEYSRAQQMRSSGHGTYTEIKDEKTLMDVTTSTKRCAVHFSKPDFTRCRVMDSHLETLAPLHLDTRFVHIEVTNAPFLVTKLQIQVLPCVIAFIDSIAKDRIIGFEGLGRGTDRFTTGDLEDRLLHSTVVLRSRVGENTKFSFKSSSKKAHMRQDDEDDEDWD